MSPPTSPIIILPNGDAVRADTITAVRSSGDLRLLVLTSVMPPTEVRFNSSALATQYRADLIEAWQAALASVPAPTLAAPGYARACAIVDEWCAGEDVDSVALVEELRAVLGGGS